jgi:hypothetical protein
MAAYTVNMEIADKKKPYVEVTRPDTHAGLSCFWPLVGFSVIDEMDSAEEGDSIVLTLRMMTEKEFEDLGDFEGW